jgi:hypothetical protein
MSGTEGGREESGIVGGIIAESDSGGEKRRGERVGQSGVEEESGTGITCEMRRVGDEEKGG